MSEKSKNKRQPVRGRINSKKKANSKKLKKNSAVEFMEADSSKFLLTLP